MIYILHCPCHALKHIPITGFDLLQAMMTHHQWDSDIVSTASAGRGTSCECNQRLHIFSSGCNTSVWLALAGYTDCERHSQQPTLQCLYLGGQELYYQWLS